MRRHVDLAQFHDEVGGIEALVATERDRFGFGAWLDHLERRQPFGMTGDPRQSRVDDEPVAVLHQGVTDEAELGFHTRPFAIEHGIGVAGRDVRLVAPLLTAEVDLGIAPAARRRFVAIIAIPRLEALQAGPGFDQRAVDREVIDDNSRLTSGCVRIAARNLAAISPSSSRSRFFENTEWSQTGSSIPRRPMFDTSYPVTTLMRSSKES